jgi:hypothetical protein
MYNKSNVNTVDKQVIDNNLYMLDNEVRNPFVELTRITAISLNQRERKERE